MKGGKGENKGGEKCGGKGKGCGWNGAGLDIREASHTEKGTGREKVKGLTVWRSTEKKVRSYGCVR